MRFKKSFLIVSLLVVSLLLVTMVGCGNNANKPAEDENKAKEDVIVTWEDLGKEGKRIAIGDPEAAPVGKYTMKILENLEAKDAELKEKIEKNIVTKEPNVRAVLDKVIQKEVDAGFVYQTDAFIEKDKLNIIEVPEDIQVPSKYGIGVLKETDDKELAEAFVAFIMSKEGQAKLESYGFIPAVQDPKDFEAKEFKGEKLVVYAAASMTDALEDLGKDFTEKTGAEVIFEFGASGTLRQKMENGAVGGESGADVFASADTKNPELLKEKGLIEDYFNMVDNKVVVISAK